MANTYINIILHLVFAVKNRENIIPSSRKEEVYRYISGSFERRGHHVIEIGGTTNHIHILFRYNPNELLSDLVRDIKSSSSVFISKNRISPFLFNWQRGYGCFSVDCGSTDKICEYIRNQEEHHKAYQIKDELRRLLKRCGMAYSEEYLFEDV